MLIEWIKSILRYFKKSSAILTKDVNGNEFSMCSRCCYCLFFVCIAILIVVYLPKGISNDFIDYIKDILAIFVGFFVTVLTFVFDKLDVDNIPSEEQMNNLPANQRWSSDKILKVKREHNYTIRFFYSVGLIILLSTFALILLIPNIFWESFFNVDWRQYVVVDARDEIDGESIRLCIHILFCVLYRFVIIFLILKVFYFTLYTVSSLLQVLISKKKIESWK